MIWDTPDDADLDDWEKLGNPGWGVKDMAKYFRMAGQRVQAPSMSDQAVRPDETVLSPSTIVTAPISSNETAAFALSYPSQIYNQSSAVVAGLAELHISRATVELNTTTVLPLIIEPTTNQRSDARAAYLDPVLLRPNLNVLTGQMATRVLFDTLAQSATASRSTTTTRRSSPLLKAIGVEFASSPNGTHHTIDASREVILAAGAIKTPQLLMLSGIGPAAQLRKHRIQTQMDLPGVGQNLQDHYVLSLSFPNETSWYGVSGLLKSDLVRLDQGNRSFTPTLGPLEAVSFAPFLPLLGNSSTLVNASLVQTVGNSTAPALLASFTSQLKLELAALGDQSRPIVELLLSDSGGWTLSTLRALSRGNVALRSFRPFDSPVIDPGYLSNPLDMTTLLAALHQVELLHSTPSLLDDPTAKSIRAILPKNDVQLKQRVKSLLQTGYSLAGTAAMMPLAKGGVVDTNLLVYGTENLRIVDASVVPLLPAAGLLGTVAGVAERAADIVVAARGATASGSLSSPSLESSIDHTTTTGAISFPPASAGAGVTTMTDLSEPSSRPTTPLIGSGLGATTTGTVPTQDSIPVRDIQSTEAAIAQKDFISATAGPAAPAGLSSTSQVLATISLSFLPQTPPVTVTITTTAAQSAIASGLCSVEPSSPGSSISNLANTSTAFGRILAPGTAISFTTAGSTNASLAFANTANNAPVRLLDQSVRLAAGTLVLPLRTAATNGMSLTTLGGLDINEIAAVRAVAARAATVAQSSSASPSTSGVTISSSAKPGNNSASTSGQSSITSSTLVPGMSTPVTSSTTATFMSAVPATARASSYTASATAVVLSTATRLSTMLVFSTITQSSVILVATTLLSPVTTRFTTVVTILSPSSAFSAPIVATLAALPVTITTTFTAVQPATQTYTTTIVNTAAPPIATTLTTTVTMVQTITALSTSTTTSPTTALVTTLTLTPYTTTITTAPFSAPSTASATSFSVPKVATSSSAPYSAPRPASSSSSSTRPSSSSSSIRTLPFSNPVLANSSSTTTPSTGFTYPYPSSTTNQISYSAPVMATPMESSSTTPYSTPQASSMVRTPTTGCVTCSPTNTIFAAGGSRMSISWWLAVLGLVTSLLVVN